MNVHENLAMLYDIEDAIVDEFKKKGIKRSTYLIEYWSFGNTTPLRAYTCGYTIEEVQDRVFGGRITKISDKEFYRDSQVYFEI